MATFTSIAISRGRGARHYRVRLPNAPSTSTKAMVVDGAHWLPIGTLRRVDDGYIAQRAKRRSATASADSVRFASGYDALSFLVDAYEAN